MIRLQDMIDNITEEAFRDWDEKRNMADRERSAALSTALSTWAVGEGRPEMLSDRLGYPSSVGDADWRDMQERPTGADQ